MRPFKECKSFPNLPISACWGGIADVANAGPMLYFRTFVDGLSFNNVIRGIFERVLSADYLYVDVALRANMLAAVRVAQSLSS